MIYTWKLKFSNHYNNECKIYKKLSNLNSSLTLVLTIVIYKLLLYFGYYNGKH